MIDATQIDPDKPYTVTLDRDGWPVREIDTGTGEIITFDRGPEVNEKVRLTGRQLLELASAGDRTRATDRPQIVHMFLEEENLAVGEDGELIETDVTKEARRRDQGGEAPHE